MAFTVSGALLLGVVLWDIIVTTVTGLGAGPIAGRLMAWSWSGLLFLHRPDGRHRLLAIGGVAVVVSTVLLWVLLLWIGWSLVFLGSAGAIVTADGGQPAGFWAHVYYAGFSLFTLGLGDYKPVGPVWQILTALCAANGLLALTLSVTYLIPVISAASQKRQLASIVSLLGGTPVEILRRNWNGSNFQNLEQPLAQLYPLIVSLGQQHLTYPSLHYLHSADSATAGAVRIAALDEAISILDLAVRPELRPDQTTLMLVREAIAHFLTVLETAHIGPADEAPPVPSTGGLPPEGLLSDAPPLADSFRPLAPHRRLMRGFVENDGWSWEETGKPLPASVRWT